MNLLNPEIHVRIVGALILLLATSHIGFPRWLAWRTELPRLSLLNHQVFRVHALFISLVLVLMGLLSVAIPGDLVRGGRLGVAVAAGLATFWAVRVLVQFFVYSPTLWRGRRSRTLAHIVAATASAYFAGVYVWAAAA